MESILPYIRSRCIPVTQSDLVSLLSHPNPLTADLSHMAQDAIKQFGGSIIKNFLIFYLVTIAKIRF